MVATLIHMPGDTSETALPSNPSKSSAPIPSAETGKALLIKLKREGNKAFAIQKSYQVAIKKYTEALAIEVSGEPKQSEIQADRAKLFANRAACYIRLEKFEEGLEDCNEALQANPKYVKAAYRKAICLDKLEKPEEAIKVLKQSLRFEKNAESEKLLKQLTEKTADNSVPRASAMKIARFSNLNSRKRDLELELTERQNEIKKISDAIEMFEEILDEDSSLMMVGDIFLPVEDDEATEYAEKRKLFLNEEIERISTELNVVLDGMANLKVELKGKFGDAINLEE